MTAYAPPAVLVVADDVEAGQRLTAALTAHGYRVTAARPGRDTLTRLGEALFDVALLYLRQAAVKSDDLLREIGRVSPDTEVIAVPARPFETDDLLAALTQALEKRDLVRVLRESEERYRLVTEHISDAVLLCDLNGRLVMVNRRLGDLTGYTTPELLGRPILSLLAGKGVVEFRSRIEAAMAGRPLPPILEVQIRRKNGSILWVEANVTRVVKHGSVVGHLTVVRDATIRRRLEEDLRQAQKMEAIGRLAGGVAHDFNNLLTVIRGYSELLLDRLNSGHAVRPALETIVTTAERASTLTNQLLAFSRKQILQPRVLDLNTTVTNLEPLLRRLIREDVELVTGLEKGLGHVLADPGQIEQVVLNLVVNARDAMPHGGRITLSTTGVTLDEEYARTHPEVQPGCYVVLSISDTGTGIPLEVRSHLFEPFFTTKAAARGTGLGLATVYGIVKQSGGHITVDSEDGRGATFRLFLPRSDAPIDLLDAAGESARPQTGWETVLLVEDEDTVRQLARETLEVYGYTVLEAPDAARAIELARRHPETIHLLLTDVVMPGMGGRELAEQLDATRPEFRTLFMSGYTDDSIVHQGILQGGTSFIQKPFSPQSLARKVREVLDTV